LADGGEVDAGVPAEEKIDVCRYMFQLGRAENSRFLASLGMTILKGGGARGDEEGLQQFGDAGGVHAS
jgi:hypothetical protein